MSRKRAVALGLALITVSSLGASSADAAGAQLSLAKDARHLAASVGHAGVKAGVALGDAVQAGRKTAKKVARTVTTAVQITRGGPTSTLAPVVGPSPVGVSAIGSYSVGELSMSFVDTSRQTGANGATASQPSRTIATTIWYPSNRTGSTTFPVLVFGHGLGALPTDYRELLRPVASAGYIVVAPAFPLANKKTPGGATLVDEPNQPGDMKFALDQVIALGSTVGSPLEGIVDASRLAASGHSLGGITTIDYAYSACCVDKRLKAAIPISSIINVFSGAKLFTGPRVPLLLIHGDADQTVPYSLGSVATYSAAPAPKALLTIRNGDHSFGLGGDPSTRPVVGSAVVQAMVAFLDRYLKADPTGPTRLQALATSQPTLLRLDSDGIS